MSDQVFEGAVRLERVTNLGMITIRGDFSQNAFQTCVEQHLAPLPSVRKVSEGKKGRLAWMSPDELLALTELSATPALCDKLTGELKGTHSLVQNVSDARAIFRLTGAGAKDVIAKGAPVDLSDGKFGPSQLRRTRLAQVAAAFWMSGESQIDLICFRSVADFVHDWLKVAATSETLPHYY